MSPNLTEVDGNIFSASSEYSLAHCVGADFRMGKGIAVEFMKRFGQRDQLKKQSVRPGGVAVLQDQQRFIYYLVTKELSSQSATYDMLFTALKAMRTHMINNEIKKLAIPKIGSGLDKLNWSRVKEQIMEVFAKDSVEIVVYKFIRNKN